MTGHLRGAFLVIAASCFAAATLYAGGWAVVTLDHLPEHVVAGEPVTLAYTVRQHGSKPLAGLTGRVFAKAGRHEVTADASAGTIAGHYAAALTFPVAGDWSITVESGFGPHGRLALLPLRVVDRSEGATPQSAADRGRQLFVAKGCGTCHTVNGTELPRALLQGPALVPHKYQTEYLAQVLANPALIAPVAAYGFRMPDLSLDKPEIEALVAFLNPQRTSATNSSVRR